MLPSLSRHLFKLRPFLRYLNLCEYQSKTILAENNCTVQKFCILERGKYDDIQKIDAPEYAVKAQIACGDRGRGIFTSGFRGGVHLTKHRQEAIEIAQRMLGQVLVTNQTGNSGALVDKVIVAESVKAFKQKSLCFTLDSIHGPTIFVSDECGIDFGSKDAVQLNVNNFKLQVFRVPLQDALAKNVVKLIVDAINFGGVFQRKIEKEINNLWNIFNKYYALHLEINPFILSNTGQILCLDVKFKIDDSALKLPKILSLLRRNIGEQHLQNKINYMNLGGNIGCIVDGAGLALVTNDLLISHGGKPANFLNLNLWHKKSHKKDNIHIAIEALTSNTKIRSILVNINWNSDCTQIAKSLIDTKLKLPIVLRLKGINDEAAWKMLESSGLKVYRVADSEEAARKVVALSDVSETLAQNK